MNFAVIAASRGLLATIKLEDKTWASASHHTISKCKVSTSDRLWFLRYRVTKKPLSNDQSLSQLLNQLAQFDNTRAEE